MHVSIKLQTSTHEFRFEDARRTYMRGGFYCVIGADESVRRFPINDVMEIKEESTELPLDASLNMLKVQISRTKSSQVIFLDAVAAEQCGPFYSVKQTGRVLHYHLSTIFYVKEEPVEKPTGKVEPADPRLMNLFQRAKVQLELNEIFSPPMPDKCGIGHLLTLCTEALANSAQYPNDKLCRWYGFVLGVLSTMNFGGQKIQCPDLIEGDLPPATQNVLNALFCRYLDLISTIAIGSPLREGLESVEIMIYDSLEDLGGFQLSSQSIRLGHVQGVLAAKGLINVDEEREFTRPLLHSLHDHPVPSFSGA
jgi:hypothetical protein